jgi:hypothetical protein
MTTSSASDAWDASDHGSLNLLTLITDQTRAQGLVGSLIDP